MYVSLAQLTPRWAECRCLTASVLPVRMACNLHCPFCFSKSSISALKGDRLVLTDDALRDYYWFAKDRGASRLVITGGGEPLLRPDDVVHLVELGREFFSEIACFTNGTFLTRALAERLVDAGLSYVCYSRHHDDDAECRRLMGQAAPTLKTFFEAAKPLRVRATCVMAQGFIDSTDAVFRYMAALESYGVREFTFKHTYVARGESLFQGTDEDHWARRHRIEVDPFRGLGRVVGVLPWGPCIRSIEEKQVCFYREPTPAWELEHKTCRSFNLLSDGSIYASLEDRRSLLCLPKRSSMRLPSLR